MIDNGLLKYYPEYFDEFGRLQFDTLKIKSKESFNGRHSVIKVQLKNKLFSKENSNIFYFHKSLGRNLGNSRGVQVDIADNEVLLSQIYTMLGLKSAIYIPTIDKDNVLGVVSNNMVTPNSQTMLGFSLSTNLLESYENYKFPYDCFKNYSEKELFLHKYFEEKALKDYVKMHVIDVACNNTDRNVGNFYVDVIFDENNMPKIHDIRLFDYEMSGLQSAGFFKNGLGNGNLKTKEQMIEEFKTNEYVNSFYTPAQLAEMLGNIDVIETARDIKQTINYEIDDGLASNYARLIDDTAEALIK